MSRETQMRLLVLAIATAVTACSRHVVIEPEMVGTRNQSDWAIATEPTSAPPAPPNGPAAQMPNAEQAPESP